MRELDTMRDLVEALCSERCAGRAPGTQGGREGRRIIAEALKAAGLEVVEQPVPGCRGANLLAAIPPAGAPAPGAERWVLLGAHHDHLGRHGGETFWLAVFDGEEPPHFLRDGMGSAWYAAHPPVPLERIDAMLCMDLVGHALGRPSLPDEVRATVFALGAERSEGTAAHLDAIADSEPGVRLRRLDAVLPPVSDYAPFWSAGVPWVFLTCGRADYYHTPEDTPDKLDFAKMAALARWLRRWTRETCARPEAKIRFQNQRDDAATARTVVALTQALESFSPEAAAAKALAGSLLARCDERGRLAAGDRRTLRELVLHLESELA